MDTTSLISAVDLLPTFCELAGAKLSAGYRPDGVSQVDTLLGKPAEVRNKPLFWKMQSAWPIPAARPHHWVSYAIVHEHWKLLTNRDASYSELYDLTADPYEKTDLTSKNPEVVSRLKQQIEAWKQTLPDQPVGDVFSAERTQKKPGTK